MALGVPPESNEVVGFVLKCVDGFRIWVKEQTKQYNREIRKVKGVKLHTTSGVKCNSTRF